MEHACRDGDSTIRSQFCCIRRVHIGPKAGILHVLTEARRLLLQLTATLRRRRLPKQYRRQTRLQLCQAAGNSVVSHSHSAGAHHQHHDQPQRYQTAFIGFHHRRRRR